MLKRVAMALKMLSQENGLNELLSDLGLSGDDLSSFLQSLAVDFQISIFTLDELEPVEGARVFSPWERAYLSKSARDFLLGAVYTNAMTPSELEQALSLSYLQVQDSVDVEEMREIVASIVQDPERTTLFIDLKTDFIH